MALNFCRRINSSLVRNCTRFLHKNTKQLVPANILEEATQVNKDAKYNRYAISSSQRTTPPENPRLWENDFEPEHETMRRSFQNKYLQPATMPSFVDRPIFDQNFLATLQEGPIKKAQNIAMNNSASQQILESFKKKQAQNLPTRFPKMISNPFPEPLKPVFSPYTLSDQEKADQMFQDHQTIYMKQIFTAAARFKDVDSGIMKSSRKFYCTSSLQDSMKPKVVGLSETHQVRFSSNQSEGGKNCEDKSKTKQQRKFHKIKVDGCPPVRPNTICKPKSKEVSCKKVDAPYPSYSESCYMQPKVRLGECQGCPWNEKTNPHYKGRFKKPGSYHTLSCFLPPPQKSVENIFSKSPQEIEHKNAAQIWMHRANLSQLHKRSFDIVIKTFANFDKTPKTKNPPNEYSRSKETFEKRQLQSPDSLNLGNYERHWTVLSEFFAKNKNLLENFKNGDDLSEFGIKKSSLSRLLSSDGVFDIVCKKKERIIPDYPKDCNKPREDKIKNCPTGLTRRPTKKDRLKRKTPKDQST